MSLTALSVPKALLKTYLAFVLVTAPPSMVPDKDVSPPSPNIPPLMSSVLPVLVNVPVRFTLPPVRVRGDVKAAAVKVPPKLRVPLLTLRAPALLQVDELMVKLPPLTSTVPVFVNDVAATVIVCSGILALTRPALLMLLMLVVVPPPLLDKTP